MSSEFSAADFEKAVGLYTSLNFPDSRAAHILARTGYPRDWIVARYPAINPSDIPPSASRPQPVRQARAPAARGGEGGTLPPTSGQLLHPILQSIATTTPATPRTPSVADAPAEESDTPDIAFQYVPLIQCSFPHADPGAVRSFTRRNGWLELTLATARDDIGLPYGVPARLLTMYCASEAIRTRSSEIFLGESVNEFLRILDIPITRGARGSKSVYADQMRRLIHCVLTIDENVRDDHGRAGLHIRQALFAEEARLWWDDENGVGRGSSLVLSPSLFDSMLERSAPLSTTAIRALRKSPMDLDVYAWLVHRLYTLTKPSSVSWTQLSGQFGHSYSEPRKFRRFFLDSLKRVLQVYPDAKVKPSDAGLLLLPSKPHVASLSAKA